MKILDWYILKKFLVTFFFAIIMITIIAVIIDTSEKTDDFVKSGLSTKEIITQYYFGFIPFIISMIFPLIVFIAVIFFTSKMAGRSETVAILANGINFNRMLRPYFIGAFILSAILWFANQYIIPKANALRSDFQVRVIDKNSYQPGGNTSSYYLRVDPNTFVGMRYYDTSTKAASGFFLQRIKDNKVVYNLRAESVRWDTVHKNWKLENVFERKIGFSPSTKGVEGENAAFGTDNSLREQVRQIPSMNLNLNVLPNELYKDEYVKDKLTTPQLVNFIHREELRGAEGLNTLKVERYRRNATPVSIFILTVIGVAVSARKTRGGSGLPLAIGIVMAACFVVMDRFSTVFSQKGNLHPVIAAWVPNLIFSCLALYMYKKAPK
ncbi:MAG: LptF/LptG family permease [Williamsia sp.]|nr:LptF/LptG family permease [Williamsia sp.]